MPLYGLLSIGTKQNTIIPEEGNANVTPLFSGLSDEARGLWLGFIGVVIFAATLPITRLAVGPADAPQLPPVFVTMARAAIAGLLSVLYLRWKAAGAPPKALWAPLVVSALGTAIGFPLFLGLALRYTNASHAAVISGLIPLATAVVGALWMRQRPSAGFWCCALLGFGLVVWFALLQGEGKVSTADIFLLFAILSTAVGYVAGAQVSARLSAPIAICWVLVVNLPVSLVGTALTWPEQPAHWVAWASLGYVAVFSMWLGFFAWYRGLVLGGTLRVSQVQLLQPFIAIVFAVPLTHEPLTLQTVGFALAIIATVLASRKMATNARR
ncbi:MAG: DMT family transporter [Burkholderiaceae bacterium]